MARRTQGTQSRAEERKLLAELAVAEVYRNPSGGVLAKLRRSPELSLLAEVGRSLVALGEALQGSAVAIQEGTGRFPLPSVPEPKRARRPRSPAPEEG